MHYHLEVIMPPTNNIDKALESILSQFDENYNSEDGATGNEFWDFFVVGGRWAGAKETCRYDAGKMEAFYKEMNEKKVTVSGLQCGKQKLDPANQIPMVDDLWCKYFPTENGEITPCPLFSHSNNQYDSNDLLSCDICKVDEIPSQLKVERVIIAGPDYDDEKLEAKFMLCGDQWNGVNHMPIDWDGMVLSAIEKYKDKIKSYKDEYRNKQTPKPDWICVTVDYHS